MTHWRQRKVAVKSPRGVFTEYVGALGSAEAAPLPDSFQDLWKVLRDVLRHRLRLRGLWNGSPDQLGILGWSAWQEQRPGTSLPPIDALDELALDCYSYIFVRRLRALKAQLVRRANIDGYLFTNVDNFLYERQRAHDRLGFRVYEVLVSAVEAAVCSGELHSSAGDGKIRNDTLLSFFEPPRPENPEPSSGVVDEVVQGWVDHLLPGVVTAQGKRRKMVEEELRSCLPDLRASGVEELYFGQLIQPLKQHIRARWSALFERAAGEQGIEEGEDGFVDFVRLVPPDTSIEEREQLEALADCVGLALRDPQIPRTTAECLHELLRFLLALAAEPGEMKMPSQVKLAQLLGIRRQRLPDLYALLGTLVARCRRDLQEPWDRNPGDSRQRNQGEDGR